MKYLHYFETEEGFIEERNNNYIEPWTSYTEERGIDYNKPDYNKIPFTIEALGDGNITWGLDSKSVQYSKNGSSWETMNSSTTISVVQGDEIQFKGTNENYSHNGISSTASFNVKGNIMSLIDADNFETIDTLTGSFSYMLRDSSTLISAIDLKLPAITLSYGCYSYMFQGCINLILPPSLPATTLARSCYQHMFSGCTNLKYAPELPATDLIDSCYFGMFYNCRNITAAPVLPSLTLASQCYNFMFYGCSKLTYIKALFTTTPSVNYTSNWVEGVASSGIFVKHTFAGWTTTGYAGVPSGWQIQRASA